VELHRPAEPGNADDRAAGTHDIDRLQKRLIAGEALLRAPAGTFEDDIGADAAGQIADRGDDITRFRIECAIGPEFAGHLTGFVTHVNHNDLAGTTDAGDLQALEAHAPLTEDRNGIRHSNVRGLDG